MCFWNITVRPGRTIQVKFITLEMNSMNSFACEPSYVLVSQYQIRKFEFFVCFFSRKMI